MIVQEKGAGRRSPAATRASTSMRHCGGLPRQHRARVHDRGLQPNATLMQQLDRLVGSMTAAGFAL